MWAAGWATVQPRLLRFAQVFGPDPLTFHYGVPHQAWELDASSALGLEVEVLRYVVTLFASVLVTTGIQVLRGPTGEVPGCLGHAGGPLAGSARTPPRPRRHARARLLPPFAHTGGCPPPCAPPPTQHGMCTPRCRAPRSCTTRSGPASSTPSCPRP